MFQDTSDFFLQNDMYQQQQQYGLHSTPNSQYTCTESETSFDSGYLSPANSQNTPGTSGGGSFRGFCPITNDKNNVPVINNNYQSSLKPHQLTGITTGSGTSASSSNVFDDEWDKKFIENFEANLFGIDPTEDFSSEDINLFSELLSSPLKTGLSPIRLYDTKNSPSGKYSRSPLKLFLSPPKSLTSRRNLLGIGSSGLCDFNSPSGLSNSDSNEHITLSGFSDTNLYLTSNDSTSQKPSCMLDQSLLTHNYAKPPSMTYNVPETKSRQSTYPKTKFPEIQPAPTSIKSEPFIEIENCTSPELLPSKQKLQYARAKFRQTLQKAVENANTTAINEEKYPQLTKRLSKTTSLSINKCKQKENVASSTLTSSEEEQNSSHVTEGSIGQSTSKHRFRELAPALSNKRTFTCIVNNQYEVQQQSDCHIVIKKRKA